MNSTPIKASLSTRVGRWAAAACFAFGIAHSARAGTPGLLDTTFADPGITAASPSGTTGVYSLDIDSNGKIVVLGNFNLAGSSAQTYGNLARFNQDGTLDTTFQNPNINAGITAGTVLVLPSGKILAGGNFQTVGSGNLSYSQMARFNSDGTVDTSFSNPQISTLVRAIAVDSNQKIYAAGTFLNVGGNTTYARLARFNSDGTLDTSFTPPAFSSTLFNVAPDSSGKVYVGGTFSTVTDGVSGTLTRKGLVRLNSNGTIDTSFADPNLFASVSLVTRSIVFDSNGKVMVAGTFTTAGAANATRRGIARFNTDGTLDSSFVDSGYDLSANRGILLQANDKVLVANVIINNNNTPPFYQGLLLLNSDGSLDTSFGNPRVTGGVLAMKLNSSDGIMVGGTLSSLDSPQVNRSKLARLFGNPTPPVISSVTGPSSGTYRAGQVLSFTVNFTQSVVVTGSPRIPLTVGGSSVFATYASGSGTTALVFSYSVQSGDLDADGILAYSPISLNSGTINTAGGTSSGLAFTAPNTSAVLVDAIPPAAVSVTSSKADGIYDVGTVIAVAVSFTEAVTVTGTPSLTLETGSVDQVVNYTSGSGSTTLTFNYTVQSGDTSTDLDYASTSALSANGGTIRDAAGNDAVLTLSAPGTAGSLGASKAIRINTSTPTDIILSANRVVDQASIGTTVGTLSATDADAGETFSYSLVSGTGSTGNARFSISGSTLQVQTVPALADSSYSIRVRATDAAGHFFEKAFTILVLAVRIDPGDYLIADRGPYRNTGTILVVNKTGAVQRVISTQLKDPYDITADAAGNLIVADYDYDPTGFGTGRGSSIFRINLQTGAATRLVAGKALVTPIGVKVESDGKLLVADPDYGFGPGATSAGAVFRIDPDVSTNRLSSLNQFYFLQGLALAPNGDIYVSDFGDGGGRPNRVIKVDPTTGVQTVMTSGGLQRPIGMAVESDGASLVVVDAVAKKLVRVTLPGGVQSDVSADSQFIQPTHVAIEADGNYIVTDGKTSGVAGERRVYRVNKNTGAATVLVSDGFFQQPRGVAIAR